MWKTAVSAPVRQLPSRADLRYEVGTIAAAGTCHAQKFSCGRFGHRHPGTTLSMLCPGSSRRDGETLLDPFLAGDEHARGGRQSDWCRIDRLAGGGRAVTRSDGNPAFEPRSAVSIRNSPVAGFRPRHPRRQTFVCPGSGAEQPDRAEEKIAAALHAGDELLHRDHHGGIQPRFARDLWRDAEYGRYREESTTARRPPFWLR